MAIALLVFDAGMSVRSAGILQSHWVDIDGDNPAGTKACQVVRSIASPTAQIQDSPTIGLAQRMFVRSHVAQMHSGIVWIHERYIPLAAT